MILSSDAKAIDYRPAIQKAGEAVYHATIRPDIQKLEEMIRLTTIGKVLGLSAYSYRCFKRKEVILQKSISSDISSRTLINRQWAYISFTYIY